MIDALATAIDGFYSWLGGIMMGFVIGLAVSMTEWWKKYGPNL